MRGGGIDADVTGMYLTIMIGWPIATRASVGYSLPLRNVGHGHSHSGHRERDGELPDDGDSCSAWQSRGEGRNERVPVAESLELLLS